MKPCKKCDTTARDASGHCRECERLRSINRRASQSKEQRDRGRQCCLVRRKRQSGGTLLHPCTKCGNSKRNASGGCDYCAKEYQKKWYQRNKAVSVECKKKWLADNPEKSQEFDLRVRVRRYGLTVEDFHRLFTNQGGLCAICGRGLGRTDIDHDHNLGFVRGLLCHSCNIGLGAFQDNPAILSKAIQYLLAPRSDSQIELPVDKGVVCTTT
jgi:hypothetical protein